MEQALRPHRGGTVLALGILSLVIPLVLVLLGLANVGVGRALLPAGLVIVPLGVAAWILGTRQIAGMRAQRIDSDGRARARIGQVLGPIGALGWCAFTAAVFIAAERLLDGPGTTTILLNEGTTRWTISQYGEGRKRSDYHESKQASGSWILDGEASYWFDTGHLAAKGKFANGQPDGTWTFWWPDGGVQCRGNFSHGEQEGAWAFLDKRGVVLDTMIGEGSEREIGMWTADSPAPHLLLGSGYYDDGKKVRSLTPEETSALLNR